MNDLLSVPDGWSKTNRYLLAEALRTSDRLAEVRKLIHRVGIYEQDTRTGDYVPSAFLAVESDLRAEVVEAFERLGLIPEL